MNNNTKKIIAIGGGGFTHKSDPVLDKFVIDQCKKKQIKFGLLPTASQENKEKIIKSERAMNEINQNHENLKTQIESNRSEYESLVEKTTIEIENFIKNLTDKLLSWTGERWIISLSKNSEAKSIHEKNLEIMDNKIHEFKKSKIAKDIEINFPDAKLIEIKEE